MFSKFDPNRIRFALFFLDHYFRMVSDERFQRFSSDHIALLDGNAI